MLHVVCERGINTGKELKKNIFENRKEGEVRFKKEENL